jgi:hypothetical protein
MQLSIDRMAFKLSSRVGYYVLWTAKYRYASFNDGATF